MLSDRRLSIRRHATQAAPIAERCPEPRRHRCWSGTGRWPPSQQASDGSWAKVCSKAGKRAWTSRLPPILGGACVRANDEPTMPRRVAGGRSHVLCNPKAMVTASEKPASSHVEISCQHLGRGSARHTVSGWNNTDQYGSLPLPPYLAKSLASLQILPHSFTL